MCFYRWSDPLVGRRESYAARRGPIKKGQVTPALVISAARRQALDAAESKISISGGPDRACEEKTSALLQESSLSLAWNSRFHG